MRLNRSGIRDLIGRARLADRLHGGQERLGREILGQAGVAAAGQQVAIDVRQRIVIQLQQPERRVGPHLRVRHTFIVVRAATTPTARTGLFPMDKVTAGTRGPRQR